MCVWMDGRMLRLEMWKKSQEEIYECSERGHGVLYKHTSHTGFHVIPILLLLDLLPSKRAFKPPSFLVRPPLPRCALLLRPLRTQGSALVMTDLGKLTSQCDGSEGLALATTKGPGLIGSRSASHKQIPALSRLPFD